ncbi:membrane protein [Porphyromonas crevioricanis]|uniref:Membrane protein n=1 Tax=Porphyromonas crevioricanis TaxID=393921 RepID=A0A0A2FXR1_9PORP|nr:sigma-70 family RNA polymerase sigma factor [Porphyromonas crevioricanis]KGN90811.1 membrane protein [Porphyromonas crevioricanis]KGN94977.1 membrane protein [Porphyromonas crevioricanis]SJZ52142.1 RNA polymerase sigma-70 factor, ECF subfamily [Porphyromonas crevioricanis]SQH73198.1 RNA polymerase sigma factor sigM [Porphyromonas crevioricanis]GAD06613.1 sigma factor [Porphyromonas crevioricanis JCM 13913]
MRSESKEITKWVELYSEPLLNRALSMVADKEDAMDLVQEVFISASSAYDRFQGKSSPLTWLQNILRNKIADFYRDRYRKPQVVSMSDFFDQSGSWTDHSVLQEWSPNLEEPEDEKALMDTLDKCLEHLPVHWQITVKRYYIEEKKANEVCQELDIATTNLWKILQRSRMQLRKCIELNWFEKL